LIRISSKCSQPLFSKKDLIWWIQLNLFVFFRRSFFSSFLSKLSCFSCIVVWSYYFIPFLKWIIQKLQNFKTFSKLSCLSYQRRKAESTPYSYFPKFLAWLKIWITFSEIRRHTLIWLFYYEIRMIGKHLLSIRLEIIEIEFPWIIYWNQLQRCLRNSK